ncbi:MAG: FeoB-associated Cys-rich membrane protein [Planctomycetaceae bacterium]
MSDFDWQSIASLVCVLLAAAYIARATWKTFAGKKASACGSSCSGCDSAAGPKELPLVSLKLSPSDDA